MQVLGVSGSPAKGNTMLPLACDNGLDATQKQLKSIASRRNLRQWMPQRSWATP